MIALAYLVVYLFLVGMAAGWFAWLVLGKSRRLSLANGKPDMTLLLFLGVVGSFVGGFLVTLLTGNGFALAPGGMIASIAGAIIVVAIYLAWRGRK